MHAPPTGGALPAGAAHIHVAAHAPDLLKVIAFNLGSLGFLTNFSYNNYKRDLGNVINGSAKLDSCTFASETLDEPESDQLGAQPLGGNGWQGERSIHLTRMDLLCGDATGASCMVVCREAAAAASHRPG